MRIYSVGIRLAVTFICYDQLAEQGEPHQTATTETQFLENYDTDLRLCAPFLIFVFCGYPSADHVGSICGIICSEKQQGATLVSTFAKKNDVKLKKKK